MVIPRPVRPVTAMLTPAIPAVAAIRAVAAAAAVPAMGVHPALPAVAAVAAVPAVAAIPATYAPLSEIDGMILSGQVKNYLYQQSKLDENIKKAFAIVYKQSTQNLQTKLEERPEWKEGRDRGAEPFR